MTDFWKLDLQAIIFVSNLKLNHIFEHRQLAFYYLRELQIL